MLFFQGFWLLQSWDLKEEEFHHKVSKILHKVAVNISEFNDTDLPKTNLIKRRSSNYYTVNINSAIDANVLEDYLVRAFTEESLKIDFEYAVYDCLNDEYLYSNYCNLSERKDIEEQTSNLPKFDDLIYYFVVKFPSRTSHLINDLRMSMLFSILTILSMLAFIYAIWVILRQKQVTDLQKDFINNMTHEFKTPISSIKLASDYLLKDEKIKSDSRMNQYVGIIRDQNNRLNNQVEKVLNIARLEKDRFRLNKEALFLQDIIKDIVDQEKIKFENVEGKITTDFSVDPIQIQVDKLHFTNVVSNILDNALKYCKRKPEVKISLHSLKNKAVVRIQDNGIGIAKDDLKQIFNKFYRISTGNIHNVKGFGLGLFYVKNICDAHGWDIDISSTIGTGTLLEIKMNIYKPKEIL